MTNWASKGYYENLKEVKSRSQDPDLFSEEFKDVTESLRNGENYFNLNYGDSSSLIWRNRRGNGPRLKAAGIAVEGEGHIFVRKEEDDIDEDDLHYFCHMSFEYDDDHDIADWRSAHIGLKYNDDALSGRPKRSKNRLNIYFSLLKDVVTGEERKKKAWDYLTNLKSSYTPRDRDIQQLKVRQEIQEETDLNEGQLLFCEKLLEQEDIPAEWENYLEDEITPHMR